MIILCLVCLLNISWKESRRVGLLTEDYGIVTDTDLDEEEQRLAISETSFPPQKTISFRYWQCLPTDDVFMDCNDLGDLGGAGDFKHTGQQDFWIRDGYNVHHYYMRRNFSLEKCWDSIKEWQDVMWGENIVCISGEYIDMEEIDLGQDFTEKHYHWIIDRMKSYHEEWSYFLRGKDLEEALQGVEERKRQMGE